MKKMWMAILVLGMAQLSWGGFDIAMTIDDNGGQPNYMFTISHTGDDPSCCIGVLGNQIGISIYNTLGEGPLVSAMLLAGSTNMPPQIHILRPGIQIDYAGEWSNSKFWMLSNTSPFPYTGGPLAMFVFVPEPATLLMLALGAVCLRRRSTR